MTGMKPTDAMVEAAGRAYANATGSETWDIEAITAALAAGIEESERAKLVAESKGPPAHWWEHPGKADPATGLMWCQNQVYPSLQRARTSTGDMLYRVNGVEYSDQKEARAALHRKPGATPS
jgi:hypothetical protein